MAYKRVNVPEGTDVGRKLPVDACYEDEAGNRVHLECSLDASQVLPEKCEYLPTGDGVSVREWETKDAGTPMSRRMK